MYHEKNKTCDTPTSTNQRRNIFLYSRYIQKDFTRHVEYIHYNPVKHGLATAPKDWEYSSFHRYVRDGYYDLEWGARQEIALDETIGKE